MAGQHEVPQPLLAPFALEVIVSLTDFTCREAFVEGRHAHHELETFLLVVNRRSRGPLAGAC